MITMHQVPDLTSASGDALVADSLRTAAVELAGRVTEHLVTHPEESAGTESVGQLVDQLLEERARTALARGTREAVDEPRLRRLVLDYVLGLGPVEELLVAPGVQNIHITGSDEVVVDFGGGRRERRAPVVATDDELVALVQRAAARAPGGERRFDVSAPILSMELPGGERLSAVMPGIAARPTLTIRRHPAQYLRMRHLAHSGMVDQTARDLLQTAVQARLNVLISGATNSGKTTLLRALLGTLEGERLITVEDAFELGLHRLADTDLDVQALQGRPANVEGVGEVTLAELVRAALRMCPDRVIVGETRGPETIALLNAMSMGTDGSMSTIHASNSQQVFAKLAAYCAQSPERLTASATALLVGASLHLVVHIDTTPTGERYVASVREVVGAEGEQVISNEIYHRTPEASSGELLCAPSGTVADRLERVGYAGRGWV